jgi:hypothetical protein
MVQNSINYKNNLQKVTAPTPGQETKRHPLPERSGKLSTLDYFATEYPPVGPLERKPNTNPPSAAWKRPTWVESTKGLLFPQGSTLFWILWPLVPSGGGLKNIVMLDFRSSKLNPSAVNFVPPSTVGTLEENDLANFLDQTMNRLNVARKVDLNDGISFIRAVQNYTEGCRSTATFFHG